MTVIQLELQPEIEAQLDAEADACGLALNQYIEKIVESRPAQQSVEQHKIHTVREAIERILELREDSHLGGISVKDLIVEVRR